MAELNLKQITDKLNKEFAGTSRKLIFWYDEMGEFVDDIDTMEIEGAKIYHLEKDNQFYTKYFLEREDFKTSYLIYAPFPKPQPRDNHLEDTILYSQQFFADRASLLMIDLRIEEQYKYVIQKHIKFFGAKERTQKFYDLGVEKYTKENIEIAMMSVICKVNTASFDEVMRAIFIEDNFENNKYLIEIEKFELLETFWQMTEEHFGYTDPKPTLEKLLMTMFITYTERYLHGEIPQPWESFKSYKSGSIITFMDSMMNNINYRVRYDQISDMIENILNAKEIFKKYNPETLIDCDTFRIIDKYIIQWIVDRLIHEDTGAKLKDMSILELCQLRTKKHFEGEYKEQYDMLTNAFHIISAVKYSCPDDIGGIIDQYFNKDYMIDQYYRAFYYNYDGIVETSNFEQLRDLVENIYTNEYLAKLLPKWNSAINSEETMNKIALQRNFYNKFVRNSKDKVVVIISDALRYETGQELYQKFNYDAKTKVNIEPMLSVLPSYTKLGMAALLPNNNIEINDDFNVLVDGLQTDNLKQREVILRCYIPNSCCVLFDEIKNMKQAELRDIFNGMEVVYVYHNQIDARGDKLVTENEVFSACAEAVDEIFNLIKKLSNRANTLHFIVTADHGFIYKRDKLTESDKIGGAGSKKAYINRRFIISDEGIVEDGVGYSSLGWILGNDDKKYISYPISSNVFKVSGGGQNFVHGGSSPQEMIIPVLDIRVEKGHMETRPAQIALVSVVQKITNLITSIDFIQSDPVSDVIKETSYKLYFISENNEKISNECRYIADKKENDSNKRIFRLRFNFKNKKYDIGTKYYLVAYDEKNDIEVMRHNVIIDVAFANDFGFNV